MSTEAPTLGSTDEGAELQNLDVIRTIDAAAQIAETADEAEKMSDGHQ